MPAEATAVRPARAGPPGAARQLLQRAAARYARGNLSGAEELCRQLLQLDPGHADALHILGLVAWRRGDRRRAMDEIRAAIAADPSRPQPHNSLGVLLKEAGDLAGAEAAFRTAIGFKPDYLEGLTNLGNVLCETGRLGDAEAMHRRVVELAPNYAEGHNNLATTLAGQERWGEAVEECQRAVGLEPTRAEFQLNLGNSLSAVKAWQEAAQVFQRAIELAPAIADSSAGLGVALYQLRRFDEAAAALQVASRLQPERARPWSDLGAVLVELDKPEEALEACENALVRAASIAEAHVNRGKALNALGRFDEAAIAFDRAIALRPEYARAHNNLGTALNGQGRFSEALSCYARAIELDPPFPEASLNKALLHLLLGEFDAGWKLYEHGLEIPGGRSKYRFDGYPIWNGTPLGGKTVIVWSEQGIGDQIMFASLIPDLLESGARCVVEAESRLEPLFRRSLSGIEFLTRKAATVADLHRLGVDQQIFMGSLGRWFRPSLAHFPAHQAFLKVDRTVASALRDRYQQRFPHERLVGISWTGGTGPARRTRSVPLLEWAPILQHSPAAFVNLQYGDHTTELKNAADRLGIEILHDDTVDPLRDMDKFAAQVAAMDLVISVDNSTVHMAGALGVPVWIMLPVIPDWRWLLGRSESVWYPSARLFRQTELGKWQPVLAAIAEELGHTIETTAATPTDPVHWGDRPCLRASVD